MLVMKNKGHQSIQTRQRQLGITIPGVVLLASVLIFCTLFVVKLIPIYVEAHSVKSIFDKLPEAAESAEVGSVTEKWIESFLSKQFQVNHVVRVDPTQVEFKKTKDNLVVTLNYSAEENLYGNVFLTVYFNNYVELGR